MSTLSAGPVASRYAEALFGLARRKGVLEQVAADVRRIASELASPRVRQMLMNPHVDRHQRLAKLQPAIASAQPMVKSFVALLFGRGREAVLLELGQAFHRLLLDAQGVVEGVAETARPLGDTELDALATRLGAKLGKRVLLTNEVRPELVGGVRVTVGSRRLDHSVAGRLEGLRRHLMEAPLPARRG